MTYTLHELFVDFIVGDPCDLDTYFSDVHLLIRRNAEDRNVHLSNEFQTIFRRELDFANPMSGYYFDDHTYNKLLTYLYSLNDATSREYLNSAYETGFQPTPTDENIKDWINIIISASKPYNYA